jgi:hypothetical protein
LAAVPDNAYLNVRGAFNAGKQLTVKRPPSGPLSEAAASVTVNFTSGRSSSQI